MEATPKASVVAEPALEPLSVKQIDFPATGLPPDVRVAERAAVPLKVPEAEATVRAVAGRFTVCAAVALVLPLKLGSPAYIAVNVRAPPPFSVMEQVPAATVPVHVSVPPLALTVTLPLGVPLPGELGVTVKLTATAWPA